MMSELDFDLDHLDFAEAEQNVERLSLIHI